MQYIQDDIIEYEQHHAEAAQAAREADKASKSTHESESSSDDSDDEEDRDSGPIDSDSSVVAHIELSTAANPVNIRLVEGAHAGDPAFSQFSNKFLRFLADRFSGRVEYVPSGAKKVKLLVPLPFLSRDYLKRQTPSQ